MIQVTNLNKSYHAKGIVYPAIQGLDLTIESGDMLAVMGKSGAGKSTLLHILAGLDSFDKGEVLIDGTDIRRLSDYKKSVLRNRKLGIVLQDFALIPTYSVYENVMVPLTMTSFGRTEKKKKAMLALERVGMESFARKNVGQLSGGQKQRVAIARAIVQEPPILLADEPTGALDTTNAGMVMDIFKQWNALGKTVVVITHDHDVAACCRRIVVMSDGRLVQDDSQEG